MITALTRRHERDEKGFTLIELLIVIIILGILAAIVVFAVGSTRSDAVQNSCKTSLKSVALSAEAVNTKMGSYPAADTTGTAPNSTFGGDYLIAGNTQGPSGTNNGALLKAWPNSTDYTITYAQTGSGTGYTLTVGNNGTQTTMKGGSVVNTDGDAAFATACATS